MDSMYSWLEELSPLEHSRLSQEVREMLIEERYEEMVTRQDMLAIVPQWMIDEE